MTKEELRKIMTAIVASGFISDYTTGGLVERAIQIVDLIEEHEENSNTNGDTQPHRTDGDIH